MIREKVEDRKMFHIDDKIKLLGKTDFKCAHCGTLLGFSDVTIDHAIPISKAGTNDDVNIVPLCEKCNKEKGNLIIPPEYYYFFLKEKYMKPLSEAYEEYLGNVDYLTRNNFLPIDYFNFSSNGADIYLNDKAYTHSPKRAYLIKAQRSELEEIYKVYLRQFKKNNIHLDEIKKIALIHEIENWYARGAIYTLKNVSGDIVLIIPMRLHYCNLEDRVLTEGNSLVLSVGKIITVYKKSNYIDGLAKFILYLLSNGISFYGEGVFSVYLNASFYSFDYDIYKYLKIVLKDSCYMRTNSFETEATYSVLVEGVNVPYKYDIEKSKEIVGVLQNRANLSYKETERLANHYELTDKIREDIEEKLKIPEFDDILYLGSMF